MSFTVCTCVFGLFRLLSVVSFCSMFLCFLHLKIDYVAHFSIVFVCCSQFLVDCFVLGCLDWSRLFTLFRLVLVLLGCSV